MSKLHFVFSEKRPKLFQSQQPDLPVIQKELKLNKITRAFFANQLNFEPNYVCLTYHQQEVSYQESFNTWVKTAGNGQKAIMNGEGAIFTAEHTAPLTLTACKPSMKVNGNLFFHTSSVATNPLLQSHLINIAADNLNLPFWVVNLQDAGITGKELSATLISCQPKTLRKVLCIGKDKKITEASF